MPDDLMLLARELKMKKNAIATASTPASRIPTDNAIFTRENAIRFEAVLAGVYEDDVMPWFIGGIVE